MLGGLLRKVADFFNRVAYGVTLKELAIAFSHDIDGLLEYIARLQADSLGYKSIIYTLLYNTAQSDGFYFVVMEDPCDNDRTVIGIYDKNKEEVAIELYRKLKEQNQCGVVKVFKVEVTEIAESSKMSREDYLKREKILESIHELSAIIERLSGVEEDGDEIPEGA